MAKCSRPEHLARLYSEYTRSRAAFALELADLLREHTTIRSWKGVRVLDLGCGNGGVAEGLVSLGADVIGIEYDMGAVTEMAHRGMNFTVVGGDGHYLPFRDHVFDIVILCDVLEHVYGPLRMMLEVSRVLRPGGVAFVGATNRTSLANVLADPHYNVPFIPWMPKPVAIWYVTKLLKVSNTFNVAQYFFRGQLVSCLRQAGLQCSSAPVYKKKLAAGNLAAAPGRNTLRKLLNVRYFRSFAVWFAGTRLFEYFIAPGFNFICTTLNE